MNRRKNYKKNTEEGFIALISAIIISVLLLTIAISVSGTGMFSRFNVLDTESKERSIGLAEACADMAALKLTNNPDYAVTNADHSIAVTGSDTCNIVSIDPAPPRTVNMTIKTQAIVNRSYTNLIVVMDSNFSIVSWDETSDF